MPDAINIDAEADLPLHEFVSRGNARERGEEVAPLPEKVSDSDAPGEPLGTDTAPVPESSEPAIAAAESKAEPVKTTRKEKAENPIARMKAATEAEATAKREAAEAKAENARLAAELASLKAPKPAAVPAENAAAQKRRYLALEGAPKLADYQDYEDYNADVAAFVGEQIFQERMTAYRAEEQERTRAVAYQTRLEQAQLADPTLAAVIASAGDVKISLPMRDVVLESPIGPQLLKYFIEHPDDTQRILALPPRLTFIELGKIEERLSTRPAAARPTGTAPSSPVISQAHAPISPVRATPTTSDDDGDDDSISVEEHIRRENAKDRARSVAR